MLVDCGFTPEALVNNLELLGVDPGALDALVLSHGHYDHFGGLAGFLRQSKGRLRAKVPFYVGGEECFCSREWSGPPVQGDFGVLDRRALADADVTVTFAEGPARVGDHAFTTGQVPLTTFEKVLSPSRMKVGVEHGLGCYPERLTAEQREQAVVPDQFRHEIATAYNLRGKGLVVLTSCSHRGVVNIVRQAQAVSGVRKVHAVLGGFHLAPFPDDYVRQVVAGLKEIDPDHVVPMHARASRSTRSPRPRCRVGCCARSPECGSCSTREGARPRQASRWPGEGAPRPAGLIGTSVLRSRVLSHALNAQSRDKHV